MARAIRTLGEDEVVLLNEALEVVLVKLLNIGRTSNGRKEGGADGRVLHLAEAIGCAGNRRGREQLKGPLHGGGEGIGQKSSRRAFI